MHDGTQQVAKITLAVRAADRQFWPQPQRIPGGIDAGVRLVRSALRNHANDSRDGTGPRKSPPVWMRRMRHGTAGSVVDWCSVGADEEEAFRRPDANTDALRALWRYVRLGDCRAVTLSNRKRRQATSAYGLPSVRCAVCVPRRGARPLPSIREEDERVAGDSDGSGGGWRVKETEEIY